VTGNPCARYDSARVTHVELACVFGRATGERLIGIERLVLALPHLFRDQLAGVDLAYRTAAHFLVVLVRLVPVEVQAQAAARDRLAFWAARAGGRASELSAVEVGERVAFRANVDACEIHARGLAPGALFEGSARLFTDAGAPADRKRSVVEIPRLSMDATGPGWEGASYDATARRLFVAAPLSPPAGDVIALSVRVPGEGHPVAGTGKVVLVRSIDEAAPGQPAGYALEIAPAPARLHEALASREGARPGGGVRAAPRFHVGGKVRVVENPDARAPARAGAIPLPGPPSAAADRATLSYATDQELHEDFIENLSHGGAFVRRAQPPPVGTPVSLKLQLPSGLDLEAAAVVAFVKPGGMGLKFQLDAESKELLAGAIAQISARPRRALVVDDDALMVRMLSDALVERGFEVLGARDGPDGLRVLSEELLALDLLVTDVMMPGMDGVAFVKTIRRAGGETDLAIVAVTGRLQPELQSRLEAAGADAVVDKGLGPILVAKAADEVLERRRKDR